MGGTRQQFNLILHIHCGSFTSPSMGRDKVTGTVLSSTSLYVSLGSQSSCGVLGDRLFIIIMGIRKIWGGGGKTATTTTTLEGDLSKTKTGVKCVC